MEHKVTQQRLITEDITIRHQEVQSGMHVFSKEVQRSVLVERHLRAQGLAPKVDQGIVDDENLQNLLAGKTFYTCGQAFKIMPKWIREVIAKRGVRYWESNGDPGNMLHPEHGVYDAFEAGEWSVEDLVRIGTIGGQRILLDSKGRPLPSGIECGSERGLFDDRLYDIDKLFEHIRGRPDVVFLNRRGGDYGAEPAIHEVVGGDGRCVSFVWGADAATLTRILAVMDDMATDERKPTFWEAAFVADALGLRAAGFAKRDTFFDEQEPRQAALGRR